jgi:hypothetical protein
MDPRTKLIRGITAGFRAGLSIPEDLRTAIAELNAAAAQNINAQKEQHA